VQETEKQRRVAEGRQPTADVGDEESKEDHGVGAVRSKTIRAQERPNCDHRCTGRAHQGSECAADAHDGGIRGWGSADRATDVDAPADGEQGGDEDEKWNVVDQSDLKQLVEGHIAEARCEGQGEQQPPRCRYGWIAVVPHARRSPPAARRGLAKGGCVDPVKVEHRANGRR